MEKTLTVKRNSAHPKRTPLHQRKRLNVRDQDPNYHYRIVNANLERDPDRIRNFEEAGWELVTKDKAGQVGDNKVDNPSALGSAGLVSVGLGTKAVVMRIRKDWYEDDQKSKEAERRTVEKNATKSADYGTFDVSVKGTPE